MDLIIQMTNCFGIKDFSHDFCLDKGSAHLVYAPNGTMKTSFAKTLKFISNQSVVKPRDLLYPESVTNKGSYSVKLDGVDVDNSQIFVADGEDDLDSGKSFCNFLASEELKNKYDEIYNKLSDKKKALMSRLDTVSRSSNCEEELFNTFKNGDQDTIFSILERLASEVKSTTTIYDFKYNDIFDTGEKVKSFVEKHREELQTYFTQYNTLIQSSNVYRSYNGHTFGVYQAEQLEKSIGDGEFFGVEHQILLHGHKNAISSINEYKQIFKDERVRILNDEQLRRIFDKIASSIEKNKELRSFKNVIEKNPEWLAELVHFEEFRKKVWKGYLANPDLRDMLREYDAVYQSNKEHLKEILNESSLENRKWKEIVRIFNDRFFVPFEVDIENQRDIILKKEAAKLKFSYKVNGEAPVTKSKNEIYDILSRGEKRAFRIMQILFELESRKVSDNKSVLIFDDIADSFDYQNKYAIIEYLKDLFSDYSSKFIIIILTHNFDFYRTVFSRLSLNSQNVWMAIKDINGKVQLSSGLYRDNVYKKTFVENDNDPKIFISMIPYVRNLIEYTKERNSPEYMKLTQCLHQKTETRTITEAEIIDIMNEYTFGKGMKRPKSSNKVYDTIMCTADAIVSEATPDPIIIQNKIVLSIAIRLLAEQYMHDKLIEAGKTEKDLVCPGEQTGKWSRIFKETIPNDANRSIIEKVNMMTPELIHINSFMYEPLIDMSLRHLITLYDDCKTKLSY